jgi:hypothetical protein
VTPLTKFIFLCLNLIETIDGDCSRALFTAMTSLHQTPQTRDHFQSSPSFWLTNDKTIVKPSRKLSFWERCDPGVFEQLKDRVQWEDRRNGSLVHPCKWKWSDWWSLGKFSGRFYRSWTGKMS